MIVAFIKSEWATISRPKLLVMAAGIAAMLALACSSGGGGTEAVATATPAVATQTVAPTVTKRALPDAAAAAAFADQAYSAQAFSALSDLLDQLGPRESGTEQEMRAAWHVADLFREMGYPVEIRPFAFDRLSAERSGLEVTAPIQEQFQALPMSGTGIGSVSGPVVAVGLGDSKDVPAGGLEGKIALARRGSITFQAKADNLTAAGAIGVIVYNNLVGNFQGVLSNDVQPPVVSISQRDGRRIEELLETGEVVVSLEAAMETVDSQNVVARLSGEGDDVVVIGGHYDTVAGISGANDNGSGTATILTLADVMVGRELPFSIDFVAFGAEELGLVGSQHFVEEQGASQLPPLAAMFNFDALGSGQGLGILGHSLLTDAAFELGMDIGIPVQVSPGLRDGSSDHASFSAVGVPVLMFFGDDFSRIHTEFDTLEFIQPELLGGAVALAAALLYSSEFEEFINDSGQHSARN